MKSRIARWRPVVLLPIAGLGLLSLLAGFITAVPAHARVVSGATYGDSAGNTVTLNSKTVLLDSESLSVLRSSSQRQIVFENARFPQAERIDIGSVIITPASAGVLLLYVNSIEVTTDGLVVKGRPATLAEAYADLRIKRSVRFDEIPDIRNESVNVTSSTLVAPRMSKDWSYRFIGTAVEDEETGDAASAGIEISGSFSLEPEIAVDIDLRASRYEFSIVAEPSVTLSVDAEASFSVSAPLRLADIDFQRKVFFLGPVPIELHPQLSLDITVAATGTAGVSARIIDYAQEFRVGVGYIDGALRNTSLPVNPMDGFRQLRLTGTAAAQGSVTLSAELFVNLYEFAGPTLRLELVGTLFVEPLEAKWARVEADVNILIGGRISILGSEGGPEISFDVAPGLKPWVVWEAPPRDPAAFKGIVGFSQPTTRIGLNGFRCVDVKTAGVDPSTVRWRLPEAAVTSGLRLSASDTGQPMATEMTGSRACVFSGAQGLRTFVEVRQALSSPTIRHAVEVSSEVENPPNRPEKVTATTEYEGAKIAWAAEKNPSYWTVTATTKDRSVPASRKSISRTVAGYARSVTLGGLAARVDYTIKLNGRNDAGPGPAAAIKVRPLGRIRHVGPLVRLGTWSDGVGKDATTSTDAQTFGLTVLSNGTSALALVPAARVKPGATGVTLARLTMRNGLVEWYAKKADGTPLDFWRGDTGWGFTQRTFIANPEGTSVVAYLCLESTRNSCTGHFVRVQPTIDRVTKLSDAQQDGLLKLVAQGADTEGDWAMSSNGRFVVSGTGEQVSLWDLDRGSQVSSMWTQEACGDGRCGGGVHSVGISAGNRVLVSSLNVEAPDRCLNEGDLWEWVPATGKRRIVSPSQPEWRAGPGSRQGCDGRSRFVLPVGAASAPSIAFYEVDGRSRTSAWLMDLNTGDAWNPPTFSLPLSLVPGMHEVAEAHKKLALSSDGQVMAVPVSIAAADGFYAYVPRWIGTHVCHFLARVCTLSMGNPQDTLDWFNAAQWGNVQLSGSGNRVIFLGFTKALGRPTWWRQDLDRKVT